MDTDAPTRRAPTEEPILRRLKAELERFYGDRLERVLLFGSRARGDARPDSDWDVAVFLRGYDGNHEEMSRLSDLGFTIMQAGVAPVAAREAYMATFHAAQAFLFERQGDVPRTHSGVHGTFGRLAKEEPRLGRGLSKFLHDAYRLKDIADYEVGMTVEAAEAEAAIRGATEFVTAVAAVLDAG